MPRVREGGYFPSRLEPHSRAERALPAVGQEAYVHGVSSRKVDELVKALRMRVISKSRASELCGNRTRRTCPPTPPFRRSTGRRYGPTIR